MSVRSILTAALLGLAACNPDPPCLDCEGDDLADQAETPPLDLPCGDANLWTDDLNCGACGNECEIMWPGTQYETGHCIEGECGPHWSTTFKHIPDISGISCSQVCHITSNLECVPMGCSGLTGVVCLGSGGEPGDVCDIGNPHNYPHMEFMGTCSEFLPNPAVFDANDIQDDLFARCCCAQP